MSVPFAAFGRHGGAAPAGTDSPRRGDENTDVAACSQAPARLPAVAIPARVWTRFLAPVILYPLGCVTLTTGLVLLAVHYAALEVDLLVYLVAVVVSAVRWGRAAAFVAVVSSAAVADFLLTEPFYSFMINDPRQIVELALFVFVALVTSHLAARLKSHGDALRRRECEIDNLYTFSRRLAACTTAAELLSAIEDHLSVHLGASAHLIHTGDSLTGRNAEPQVPAEVARTARDLAMTAGAETMVVSCRTDSRWALKCVATTITGQGVLAMALGDAAGHGGLDDRSRALLSEATAMLTRIDAAAALAKATVRLESEVLQAALLDTASHELRSPVAAILGSASVLHQVPALRDDDKLHSLVVGMHHEAERLDTDIRKLLDTVRITDSGGRLNTRPTDLADVVAAAVRQRKGRTAAHKLSVDAAPDLPLLNLDSALVEQAIGQLIENAAKYSPAGSAIAVTVRISACHAVVSVADTGAGLTPEETDNLFRRAWRGGRHQVPGLGLGLWIARIFVAANGGTLTAHSDGPGKGTTMSIHLPLSPQARHIEQARCEPV